MTALDLWAIIHERVEPEDTDLRPLLRSELDKLPDAPEYAEVRAAVEAVLAARGAK